MAVATTPRVLQRADTEAELRRIKNRRDLREAKKELRAQEVRDASLNSEHAMAASSIRIPAPPTAPPNALVVVQRLPFLAARQALLATGSGSGGEGGLEASESLVIAARLAQQARLSPLPGPGQVMVGTREAPTLKSESSLAEQGAELQAEALALAQIEPEATKWIAMVQSKKKEMEARAEARLLVGAEFQAQQMKQQKERKLRYEPFSKLRPWLSR